MSQRVIYADPITELARAKDLREYCWTEEVPHLRPRCPGSMTLEIVGGRIGGVVGTHFGPGRDGGAATVARALPGGSIAHGYTKRRACGYYTYSEPVARCVNRHGCYEAVRMLGYDVRRHCDGRIYHTRMDRNPRSRVRVDAVVAE